jgi:hypothetical protein
MRSYVSLLAGAHKVAPSVAYDGQGYASEFSQNLMPGLPLAEVVRDLSPTPRRSCRAIRPQTTECSDSARRYPAPCR